MAVLEGSQFRYWIGPQVDQTTIPADTALVCAPGVTAGSVSASRSDGQERFPTYGGRFYGAADWVDSVQGEGELTCVGHPETVGRLAAYYLGTDTPGTAVATVIPHVITPATSSRWVTLVKKVGVLEGTGAGAPRIERYSQGRITQLVIQGSTANKLVSATPTFLFADPAEIHATTPATAIEATDRPFVYTDGSSTFKFSTDTATAVVQTSTTSFSVTMTDTLNPAPGDTITPLGYLPGESICTVAIECTANADSIKQFNRLIYGVEAPAATNKPTATLPATFGSVDITLDYGTPAASSYRSLQIVVPSVKWTPTAEIPTNTDGTPVTLSFTGEARGTVTPATITVNTTDAGAY